MRFAAGCGRKAAKLIEHSVMRERRNSLSSY